MKKRFKRKEALPPIEIEDDVAVILNKIQQQLISLEQKVDALSNRAPENSFKEKHFSRPFDRSPRYNDRRQNDRFGKVNFTEAICADCNKVCEVPFKPTGDRPVYCKDCFSKRSGGSSFKERFGNKPREGDFSQGRNFDRQRGGENRSFGKNKKSMFRKRKERI